MIRFGPCATSHPCHPSACHLRKAAASRRRPHHRRRISGCPSRKPGVAPKHATRFSATGPRRRGTLNFYYRRAAWSRRFEIWIERVCPGAGRGITTNSPLTGHILTRAKSVELPGRLDRPRLVTATRDLRRDRLVAVALQLRGLATCVVFRYLGMTHHPLEVLDQQRRYAVHEVLRNVVERAGFEPADQHEDLEIRHG